MKLFYLLRVLLSQVNCILSRSIGITLPLFLLGTFSVQGEGTKEVMPIKTQGTGLIVSTLPTFPLGNVGSYYGAGVDQRIYIRIKDFTKDTLYYGFNWETLSPSTPISTFAD